MTIQRATSFTNRTTPTATSWSPNRTSVAGILQRQCACGTHTIGGGQCAGCTKNKSSLQRKLTIGASNDPLEQEADRIADQVLTAPAHSYLNGISSRIQRFTGQATGESDTAPASVDRVLASPGRPLEPALQQEMGQRFSYDFSRVRVHTDAAAEQSARDVNAHAYTVGRDIVFGASRYASGKQEGRQLIAHELTHVVQQNGGGSLPGRKQEQEAEALSRAVSAGGRAQVQAPSGIGFAAQPATPPVADQEEYVPVTGAPDYKPLPETKPEVLGRKDLDIILRTNARLRARIESVAKELDIDPGLLAAELMAEEAPSVWSRRSGTVPSEKLGMDDWFGAHEKLPLERIIAAHPHLGIRYTDVKRTGAMWDTSTEKRGGKLKPRGLLDADKAVAAFGVYFKMQENVLRSAIRNRGAALRGLPIRTLDDLPPEQRFTVLRVGLNAGVVPGLNLFLQLAKGGDIPRSGKITRDKENAPRTAVLHVARAIHLDQAIFGRSPSDYTPSAVPISNKAASMIFELPEIRNLPDYIVPYHY